MKYGAYNEWRSKGFFRHNVVEVLSWDLSSVWCSTLQHLLQLLDIHGFSQLLGDSFNIIWVYWACVVVVEKIENLVDAVLSHNKCTRDYLSPNFEVMPSKNS